VSGGAPVLSTPDRGGGRQAAGRGGPPALPAPLPGVFGHGEGRGPRPAPPAVRRARAGRGRDAARPGAGTASDRFPLPAAECL